jgi:hypothetical protein
VDVNTPICPKCHGVMQQGFVPEYRRNGIAIAVWVEGLAEEPSFWGSIISDKQQIPIITYRCMRCGYLESYAPQR